MTNNTNIVDELEWRGLINQSTDLEALKEATENSISLYCGFDPTGSSLHAGHLVPLIMLKRFQQFGHRPIALAGGATGMIGDPRDIGERSMLTEEQIAENMQKIKTQLESFVDFTDESDVASPAVMVNNADWISQINVIEYLRDIGKNFSLNTMLDRDTVKRRLESDGISYTEFSYMLLQANDFVHLHNEYDCVLQIGGGDQWGNIVSGVDLNRRVNGAKVHGLTVPLVTDAEGNKFGKSTGGGKLWLDPQMTSPYSWYQYFINAGDAVVIDYLRWFTFLTQEEIADLEHKVEEEPYKREAQRVLAREMTTLVHGAQATEAVELASQALFGKAELQDLDEATLSSALQETEVAEVSSDATILDLLVGAGLEKSKGAARRTVGEGGAYVNNQRIEDIEWSPSSQDLLHGSWLVLRKGKKRFAGARVVNPS